MVGMLGEIELGSVERLAQVFQPAQERGAIRHDETDLAAEVLRLSSDEMELAASDIDPHVVDAGHHVGVAGKPQPADIEERRESLILNLQVYVLKRDDIAEILDTTVILLAHPLPPSTLQGDLAPPTVGFPSTGDKPGLAVPLNGETPAL
jgi:hypothetical protein